MFFMNGQFEMRPSDMEQVARDIASKIQEWQASVNKLYQLHAEMDAMWEGDANEAFNKQFAEDKPKYNNLGNLMEEYKNEIIKAANIMDNADREAATMIAKS